MSEVSRGTPPQVDAILDGLFTGASEGFLQSAVSREEGLFLRNLAARDGVRKTIEVGCANGVSTLSICAGLSSKENVSHTAIDPVQLTEYKGRGIETSRRAGFRFVQLMDQGSEIALPSLLMKGEIYDMALIDGLHTADQTMIDFYYLDRMLRPGGILVIDDLHMPAVSKIVHYISTYPNYRLIGTSGRRGMRRRLINIVKQAIAIPLWLLRKIVGEPICREFVDVSMLDPKTLWTLDSFTMAAFEKTGEYQRGTIWYEGL